MAADSVALTNALVGLNTQIAQMEQQGESSREFFQKYLSDQVIFRRASGKVVDKSAFLEGLRNNPFASRVTEDISVDLLNDRALVTLIVIGTRKDDNSVHRYRNVRLFSRKGDDWILELWYNYDITGL